MHGDGIAAARCGLPTRMATRPDLVLRSYSCFYSVRSYRQTDLFGAYLTTTVYACLGVHLPQPTWPSIQLPLEMEAAGLGVSVNALAGLFNNAVDSYGLDSRAWLFHALHNTRTSGVTTSAEGVKYLRMSSV